MLGREEDIVSVFHGPVTRAGVAAGAAAAAARAGGPAAQRPSGLGIPTSKASRFGATVDHRQGDLVAAWGPWPG